jgi:hypothetical protein
LFYANYLMKPYNFIWVVRMWYCICTDHALRCFDNPEGLSYEDLLVSIVPELLSWVMV